MNVWMYTVSTTWWDDMIWFQHATNRFNRTRIWTRENWFNWLLYVIRV